MREAVHNIKEKFLARETVLERTFIERFAESIITDDPEFQGEWIPTLEEMFVLASKVLREEVQD